jgi:hypothetical protein
MSEGRVILALSSWIARGKREWSPQRWFGSARTLVGCMIVRDDTMSMRGGSTGNESEGPGSDLDFGVRAFFDRVAGY